MPEVLAVLLVFAVSVAIYVGAWVRSRDPALYEPELERVRSEQQVVWLEERLAQARREGWGAEMVLELEGKIAEATAGSLSRKR
ncbi:hypothetical protein [Nibricoccus aquaticus]|uniref:hypothetical protein n=1 Tax=Nibricoccus aquaticus TaxID=2576891 RepID=UPI0010FF108D|nr:hypothetical protein [Nibricoccus aquaticus]